MDGAGAAFFEDGHYRKGNQPSGTHTFVFSDRHSKRVPHVLTIHRSEILRDTPYERELYVGGAPAPDREAEKDRLSKVVSESGKERGEMGAVWWVRGREGGRAGKQVSGLLLLLQGGQA